MSFFTRVTNAWQALRNVQPVGPTDRTLLEWLGIDPDQSKKAINDAVYFTCMKVLSETMGKLPLKYYQETTAGRIRAKPNAAAQLLATRPNPIMTPATFWTTLELNCEHYGNAFAWMQNVYTRNGYKTMGFWIMQSDAVQVLMDDKGIFGGKGGLYYQYTDPKTGEVYVFKSDDVLHFKTWYSLDGILGQPVRRILQDTVDGSIASDTYLNNLYKQGMTSPMVLQYTGDLDKERQKKLIEHFGQMMTGPKNIGKITPVPMGMQLQPLNMKLTDAQFFELKKYSALQIAAAFGVKPNQLNDYEKSSYANSEMQQLSFLMDAMLYRLTQFEQEINYKCLTKKESADGFFFKFNEKVLLRTDTQTQMSVLQGAVQNAIYTPNEARGFVDLPAQEGGDVLMCNGNYVPLTSVGAAYGVSQGGENDGRN